MVLGKEEADFTKIAGRKINEKCREIHICFIGLSKAFYKNEEMTCGRV